MGMSRGRRIALFVGLSIAALVMVAPFYWTIATSFKVPGDVFSGNVIPNPFTLANYQDVFRRLPFPTYFTNSVIVTASIVGLNVIFGTAAAYAFAKLRFPGRDLIFFVFLLTLMVPFQVNLIPLYRIMVELHRISPALGVDTYFGIIAPGAIQVFGIFLMRQFLKSIPDEILESARIDGASEWRILRSVVFPLAAPGMATLAIFTFIGAWNDFLWPLIVMTDDSMYTLPVALATLSLEHVQDTELMMAGSVMTVLPVLLLFVALQKYYIGGIMASGLKE